MAIDLQLMPVAAKPSKGLGSLGWMSFTTLRLSDTEYLRPRILELGLTPVPMPITCSEAIGDDNETRWGALTVDRYGQPLHWVRAEDLELLASDQYFMSKTWNRAAMGYVAALDADWPVVLLWC